MLLGQSDFLESYPIKHRNKYDFITAADLITNNVETEKIFEEMLLSLRNGGIMIFTTKFSFRGPQSPYGHFKSWKIARMVVKVYYLFY